MMPTDVFLNQLVIKRSHYEDFNDSLLHSLRSGFGMFG